MKRDTTDIENKDCGDFSSAEHLWVDRFWNAGWIVQHVVEKVKITNKARRELKDANKGTTTCDCCEDVKDPQWVTLRDFYEAFKVSTGGRAGRIIDTSNGRVDYCAKGELELAKTAVWFGGMTEANGCPQGFQTGGSGDPTGAGGTCWATNKPALWDTNVGIGQLTVNYGYTAKWECCPGIQKSTVSRTEGN